MINGVIWSYTIAMELGAEALVKGFHPRRDAGPAAMLVDEVATGFPRRSAKRGILHEPLNRASELILGSVNPDAATMSLTPTSRVTMTGSPRCIASSAELPKLSEWEGITKPRAAANTNSLSVPVTVRGPRR